MPAAPPPPFRRRELWIPLAVSLVLAAAAFRHGPRTCDDAFITFRYSRNLADGLGLVYNPGEPVLGTSAPLFAVLLAPAAVAFGAEALPRAAAAAGIALLPAVAFLVYRYARRMAPPALAAGAALASLAPEESLRIFASGMETPLYLAGLLVSMELLARGRRREALAVSALLPFLHPEGVLLFPVLVLASRRRDGTWPLRDAALALVPAAVFAAAVRAWAGTLLPQALIAKSRIYVGPPGTAFEELARSLLEPLGTALAARLASVSPAADFAVVAAAAGIVAAVLVAARRSLGDPFVLAPGLFALAYLGAFSLGNPLIFPWYRAPLLLTATLALAGAAGRAAAEGAGGARSFGALSSRVLAAALLLAGAANAAAFRPAVVADREDLYRDAVSALGLSPSDVVAAPEIGAVGFYTRARVLDTLGLVSPESLPFHGGAWQERLARSGGGPRGWELPPGLLEALRPGYVVSLSSYLVPLLEADPAALQGYEKIAEYPTTRWGSSALLVFRRRAPK